jgi:hypothetical protein
MFRLIESAKGCAPPRVLVLRDSMIAVAGLGEEEHRPGEELDDLKKLAVHLVALARYARC